GKGAGSPMLRAARELRKKLTAEEKRLFVPPSIKGIVDDRTPLSWVQGALFSLDSSWEPPDANVRAHIQNAETVTAAALAEVNRLLSEDVSAFRKQVADAHADLLPAEAPIALPKAP